MIGRVLAALTLGALTAAHPGPHAAASAHTAAPKHIAPVRTAWYEIAAAPMPGVGPNDLLVQGFTLTASQLPLALLPLPPVKQVTAFAALTYRLPKGASPASLTLKLSGFTTAKLDAKLPSGASPVACIATGGFKAGGEQPFSAAPDYDCAKRSAVGQLNTNGDAIVFPGIGRLLTNRTLSVVVLPGSLGLERLVFAKPATASLSLLSFPTAQATEPTTSSSVPTIPPSPSRPSATGSVPTPGNQAPTVPIPAASNVAMPPIPASTPQVAPTTSVAAQPQALLSAASPIDDTRARTGAVGGLVVLLAIMAWLTMNRPRPAAEFGVGKFRAPRTGPPPAI
jgi:hypothetical protein